MLLYEKNYELRVSDFDHSDNLRPSAMLDIFQSVASEHATKLNIGYSELLQQDSAWVLLRMRYDVIKRVGFGIENVVAKTWPHTAGRVDYDRDYCIESVDGERLVNASSKWCIINMQTRRIVTGNAVYPLEEYFSEVIYPEGLKKLPIFELASITESGLMCANGPIFTLFFTTDFSITLAFISHPSPITESSTTEPAPINTFEPISHLPISCTPD